MQRCRRQVLGATKRNYGSRAPTRTIHQRQFLLFRHNSQGAGHVEATSNPRYFAMCEAGRHYTCRVRNIEEFSVSGFVGMQLVGKYSNRAHSTRIITEAQSWAESSNVWTTSRKHWQLTQHQGRAGPAQFVSVSV